VAKEVLQPHYHASGGRNFGFDIVSAARLDSAMLGILLPADTWMKTSGCVY